MLYRHGKGLRVKVVGARWSGLGSFPTFALRRARQLSRDFEKFSTQCQMESSILLHSSFCSLSYCVGTCRCCCKRLRRFDVPSQLGGVGLARTMRPINSHLTNKRLGTANQTHFNRHIHNARRQPESPWNITSTQCRLSCLRTILRSDLDRKYTCRTTMN